MPMFSRRYKQGKTSSSSTSSLVVALSPQQPVVTVVYPTNNSEENEEGNHDSPEPGYGVVLEESDSQCNNRKDNYDDIVIGDMEDVKPSYRDTTTSPANTVPLTPIYTPPSSMKSSFSSTPSSSSRLQIHSLLDENEGNNYVDEIRIVSTRTTSQQQQEKAEQNSSSSILPKLVRSKHQEQKCFHEREMSTDTENELSAIEDNDIRTRKRRPLLRKFTCQKYKPSHAENDEPNDKKHTYRMTPRQLFSSSSSSSSFSSSNGNNIESNHFHQQQNIPWILPSKDFSTLMDENLLETTSFSLRKNVTSITPRIVQRLEETQSSDHVLQQEEQIYSSQQSWDDTTFLFPEWHNNIQSILPDEFIPSKRDLNQHHSSNTSSQSTYSLNESFHKPNQHYNSLHENTEEDTAFHTYDNSSSIQQSSLFPYGSVMAKSAYQRRLERFQKEQHDAVAVQHASFLPNLSFESHVSTIIPDEERSFVQWVEQIENESNLISQINPIQNLSVNASLYENDDRKDTVHRTILQAYHQHHHYHHVGNDTKKNNSFNTTAETSTIMSNDFNNSMSDIQSSTFDENDQEDEERDHSIPQFTTILPESSFDNETTSLVSVGSIDSSLFDKVQFFSKNDSATAATLTTLTPEGLIVAAATIADDNGNVKNNDNNRNKNEIKEEEEEEEDDDTSLVQSSVVDQDF